MTNHTNNNINKEGDIQQQQQQQQRLNSLLFIGSTGSGGTGTSVSTFQMQPTTLSHHRLNEIMAILDEVSEIVNDDDSLFQ